MILPPRSKDHATGTYVCANTNNQVLLNVWAGQAEPAGPCGLCFMGREKQVLAQGLFVRTRNGTRSGRAVIFQPPFPVDKVLKMSERHSSWKQIWSENWCLWEIPAREEVAAITPLLTAIPIECSNLMEEH